MFLTKVCQLCLKLMEYLLKTGMQPWKSSKRIISNTAAELIFAVYIFQRFLTFYELTYTKSYFLVWTESEIINYLFKYSIALVQI